MGSSGQQALFMQRDTNGAPMRDVDLLTAHSTWNLEEAAFARSMPRINRAQVLVAFSVCSWG